MRWFPVLIVVSLVAAACGGSGDDDAADISTTEAPTTTAPASTTSTTAPATTVPATTVAPATTAAPATTSAPTTVAPATTLPTHDDDLAALELIGDGPYEVGSFNVLLNGIETGRPIAVQVWYPLAPGATAEPIRYTFITGDYYESPRAVDLIADDVNTSADGPFPLVVYSHGSGGIRFIHSDYTEVLASHGHVVVAPDHIGNTAVEQFLGTEDDREIIAFNRVADITLTLDTLLSGDRGLEAIAAIVDPERIAVTGHSFGGFTAYGIAAGFENSAGAVPADPRVKAIIPLAPAVGARSGPALLSDDDLARVTVPALVIVGNRAWESTNSSPHHRLELVAADHQSFTDVCDYLTAFNAGQPVTDPVRSIIETFGEAGCGEGQMPIERVQELTNTFALRFLDSVFGNGEMVDPTLTSAGADTIYRSR